MKHIITPSELEYLNENQLHSKFCDLQQYLHGAQSAEELSETLSSLENIRQAIHRRKTRGPKI